MTLYHVNFSQVLLFNSFIDTEPRSIHVNYSKFIKNLYIKGKKKKNIFPRNYVCLAFLSIRWWRLIVGSGTVGPFAFLVLVIDTLFIFIVFQKVV
jgi:hypothetical protein